MSLALAEEQETLDLQGQDLGRKGAQRCRPSGRDQGSHEKGEWIVLGRTM